MISSDVLAADGLRRAVGWNQLPSHWAMMLALEPDGCFVATTGTRPVGTVTTTTHGNRLAWIGMMLVDPEFRGRGIARELMGAAIESIRGKGIAAIGLDATPAGMPVYLKLGFVREMSMQRWLRPAGLAMPTGPSGVRPLLPADWVAVEALDRAATGVDRSRVLRRFAEDRRAGFVWPAEGNPVGWALLRPGANADHVGPIECADAAGIQALLTALLRAADGRAVHCDIPDDHSVATSIARGNGFAVLRPLERMRLGPSVATDLGLLAAIADPSIG